MSYFSMFIHHTAQLRLMLAGIVFVCWLFFMAYAFWWFQFRHIDSFNYYLAEFNSNDMDTSFPLPTVGTSVVVHILDPKCPCTRFSTSHIRDIENQYGEISTFMKWQDLPESFRRDFRIPASPAVAIWSASGELAYFGPYSSGEFCGEGDDFVFATIDNLTKGTNPKWINQDAVGCFCAWES